MMPRSLAVLALAVSIQLLSGGSIPAAGPEGDEGRLLRFPTLSKESIAFVYGGDLWTVPRSGGVARQLTTDPGIEWFPRFSPDGRWIAFTGEYDGNRDVYVIPAEGGEPKRLTWWRDVGQQSERAGPNNMVIGWSRDGKSILFRSRHQAWESRAGRLYTVSVDGGLPAPLVVPEGGLASFSPDGGKLVYNRIWRNFRTWKRYRGGMTQNLWIYDLKANALEKLTENDNTSTDPMWIGGKVYFTSDREHTANIYSVDLATKKTDKLTSFGEYDVRWASDGPGGVVFENGGYLYLLDTATGKNAKIPVRIPGDRRYARPEYLGVADKITEAGLSPEGKRAVLVARGDVFTVPAEKGNTRNLTGTSSAHERGASWSPDGRSIAYLSDQTGEYEIWVVPQDRKTPAQRITTDGKVYRFAPVWSPDSKKLAFADKDLKLYLLDLESKKVTQADRAVYWEITDYTWSPDSRWLAYSKQDPQGFHQVYLYSLETGRVTRVTSELTDSHTPAFDPKGRYLYFLSNRDLNATLGFADLSYVYRRPTRVYALTLKADLPSPFAPESDEVASADAKDEKKDAEKKDGEKKDDDKKPDEKKPVEPLKIALDGIEQRLVGFPIDSGDFDSLKAAGDVVLFMSRPDGMLTGGAGPSSSELKLFDMEKRKEHVLLSAIDGYDLSPDGTKVIYAAGEKYGIVDAKPPNAPGAVKVGDGALGLSGLQMKVDHRAEWGQIFDEVWRLERDFFYAPNMHGVDWPGMKRRYGALLPYVAHRSDLTYILGEMIAELNAGHLYVGGGDVPEFKQIPQALLGADFELDAGAGRYRIARILEGQNWNEKRRSPLTEPGPKVSSGAYLLAVDGVDLKPPMTPDELLENKAGRTVTLLVNDRPSAKTEDGAREVTVKPLSDEEDLRYYDRIEANRKKVEAATGGRVAYLHIPDMGGDGLNEFVRQFYPQIRKEGLIVDVRNNGGGFVSEMILERLRRVLAGMGTSRNAGDSTYPAQVFYGPMVCLINHYSASDGDIFPYYFKKYGLGPLIGTRTWGGVVGIRGGRPLIDGGYITQPEFGNFDLESHYSIEGHGVDPDIEVDNRDNLVVKGADPQLEKGIAVVMEEIRKNPKKLPARPPDPVKN
ncbi:MAG TPA: S41 family peptidase [Candidatus Polarisedimenticolia bacterium]|nr:S41 family peptidase [Candidatus Polarisedimenticolia bacterium]